MLRMLPLDVRTSIRSSWRTPGVTILTIATLAIALAANITAFSLIDALLFRPYAYPALDRLVLVRDSHAADGAHQRRPIAPADFLDLAARSAIGEVVGYRPFRAMVTGAGDPDEIQGLSVSWRYFDVLGSRFRWGRGFLEADAPGGARSAVVTERAWRARFGSADPDARPAIQLNGETRLVVGIVRDEDAYPSGVDVWIPFDWRAADRSDRTSQTITPVIRLSANAGLERARADLDRIARDLAIEHPTTNSTRGFELLKLSEEQYEFTQPLFLLVQASAAFLLVLAGANVLNLMLTGALDRRGELAMRAALGATRSDLVRASALEAPLTAAVAGLVALGLAAAGVGAVRRAVPEGIARWIAGWSGIGVNWRLALFAVSLTVATAIIVGVVYGVLATRDLRGGLPDTARGGSRRLGRTRQMLLVLQAAAAALLLAGAGTMLQGYRAVAAAYESMDPAGLLTFELTLPESRVPSDSAAVAFYDRVLDDLRGLPGVESVGLLRNIPASNVPSPAAPLRIHERDATTPAGELPRVDVNTAGGDALSMLRVRLSDGRLFEPADRTRGEGVVLASEALAKRHWPDGGAVGRRIRLDMPGLANPVTIVGVVSDLKQNWFDARPRAVAYVPYWEAPSRRLTLMVRTRGDAARIAPMIRAAVGRIDGGVPLARAEGFDRVVGDSLSPVRVLGVLLLGCGAIALLLSAAGMYASLRTYVAAREREFAIRAALGASPAILSRLVVQHAGSLCALGSIAAIPILAAIDRVAGPATFGLIAFRGGTIAATLGIVLTAAMAAAWGPTRRALRIQLSRALQR